MLFGDREPLRHAVPVRAPRHRLARAARRGRTRGDRRPLPVADQLLADPAGDARLRAAVRRPRRASASSACSAPTGRSSSRRPTRRARRRARAAARRPGAAARRARAGREFVAERTWDHAADQLEAGLRDGAARARAAPRPMDDAGPARRRRRAHRGVAAERARRARSSASRRCDGDRAPVLARLDPADVAAVEAASRATRALATGTRVDPSTSAAHACVFGVWHGVPAVLEKTGLRPDAPPEDVHAMARGPLAAGGAIYYADMLAEALAPRRRRDGRRRARPRLRLLLGARRARAGGARSREAEWHGCDPNERRDRAGRSEHLPGIDVPAARRRTRRCPTTTARSTSSCAISIWSHYGERAALALARRDAPRSSARAAGSSSPPTACSRSPTTRAPASARPSQLERDPHARSTGRGFWFAAEFGEEGDWGVKHPRVGHGVLHARVARSRTRMPGVGRSRTSRVGQNADNQDVYVLRRR